MSSLLRFLLQTIFYLFILSGFSWQIGQISINYFKYETVSVITIIMPENDVIEKYFSLCFWNYQMRNKTSFDDFMIKNKIVFSSEPEDDFAYKLTLKQRLDLTNRFAIDWSTKKTIVDTYMFKGLFCHQKKSTDQEMLFVFHAEKLSDVHLFFSLKFPNINWERSQVIAINDNRSVGYALTSYVNHVVRMTPPYEDNCEKYTNGRLVTYHNCVNDKLFKNKHHLYDEKFYNIKDANWMNHTIHSSPTSYENECKIITSRQECESYHIFTYIKTLKKETNKYSAVYGFVEKSNTPSQKIESKPKIETIDYVTYIF